MYEWWRFVIIVGLIALSGLFSGLTLGLLGLDTKNLEVSFPQAQNHIVSYLQWDHLRQSKIRKMPSMPEPSFHLGKEETFSCAPYSWET